MKQKLYKSVGLLSIEEKGKFMLYKLPKDFDESKSFALHTLPFLTEPQITLDVYPEANLIVTQDRIFTLDGRIVMEYNGDSVQVELVSDKWMIIQDSHYDNDVRYRITLWDGFKDYDYIWGRYFMRSNTYFAVYTLGDKVWRVFTYDGACVLNIDHADAEFILDGFFLISASAGNHSIYTLIPKETPESLEHAVFLKQPLIMNSKYDDFAVCANIRGEVTAYYHGKYFKYGRVESIDLYDRACIFSLKINGRYFLYHFNGERYGENICPFGADAVAYDCEHHSLLINTNGVWRLFKF